MLMTRQNANTIQAYKVLDILYGYLTTVASASHKKAHNTQRKHTSSLPGMPVRIQSCMGTEEAAGAHSPATAGTPDIAH